MMAQIKLKFLDSKQGGLGLIIAMLKGDGIKYTEIKKIHECKHKMYTH